MHREHAPAIAAASSTAPTTGSKCKPAAAAEGNLISFPPLLKQQLPASATPLHFQQQPTLLSSGSMDFRDLSSSHCEQQQLFLLSHRCIHRSSALARTRSVEREREREQGEQNQLREREQKTREKDETEKKRRKDRGGLFEGCPTASHQHRRLHVRYAIFTITILITFLLSTHT